MSMGMWKVIESDLRKKIDSESYNGWFGKVEIEERKNTLILWVPSLFHKDWIDEHFKGEIKDISEKYNRAPMDVRVLCKHEGGSAKVIKSSKSSTRYKASLSSTADFLNPLYTFDSFVVGTSNQFAHAACQAVAESPSMKYNPLFLYGGVGLGKTHLMQAVGHYVLRNEPGSKVIYVSAEQFTNEFINSIRDSKMDAFQKKFRECDLLLVDDVQFIANKDKSREEFFHTFTSLYESKRQLVISSDRTPQEIPMLEDRLKSRLSCGLITDIQPPNLETRIAILRKKADDADINIPQDSIEFIAQKVKSNIRDLEGALMRVGAMATFTNRPINMTLTEEALRDLLEVHREGRTSVDQIQKAVSEYFKVLPQELKSKRRTSDVTLPRQIAMYICREMTGLSLPVIGMEFGGRDHTTVLHSCKKITNLVERDRHLRNIVSEIKTNLR